MIIGIAIGMRIFVKICKVLGTDDFYRYLAKYGLELDPQLEAMVGRWAEWGI